VFSTVETASPTPYRLGLVICAVAMFSGLCIGLVEDGLLLATVSAAILLLGVWSAGLLGLTLADAKRSWLSRESLILVTALWCNLGAVITALLVPHSVRLLLLVVPLFGLLFAALHLQLVQMLSVAAVTWLVYLGGVVLLFQYGGIDLKFELLLLLAFTSMIVVMVIMAAQVTTLKSAFERRREHLNEAMARLADLAMRDELTGLYNRRYIMDVLNREKALADRGHAGFTLCYCDLDYFKRVNDRYGHQAGDQLLRDFAEVARRVVRSADYVARLGGEEFLLVLSGADASTAQAVAERLCTQSKRLEVNVDGADYQLSVSIGIASYRAGERIEDVIQRADRALYAAKSAGRDRIVIGE